MPMTTATIPQPQSEAAHLAVLRDSLQQLLGPLDASVMEQLLAQLRLVTLDMGATLYHQGDAGNTMHILLSGRLRVEIHSESQETLTVAQLQPGELVGEIAWLTSAPRAATVRALRDSTLAVFEHQALDHLIARQPELFGRLSRLIVHRLLEAQQRLHSNRPNGFVRPRILMLLPLHDSLELGDLLRRLHQSLLRHGRVLQLDAQAVSQRLGLSLDSLAQDAHGQAAIGRLLDDTERHYDSLLLLGDAQPSLWNRYCHGHADRIVLLADSREPPTLTPLEAWLDEESARHGLSPDQELVLVQAENCHLPSGTRDWLAQREVARHHHLRQRNSLDMHRLARHLCNQSIGLVLAGGGARGFAHLGVIRALHELGIPIDSVGGTSFGALAATGVARGLSDEAILAEQELAFSRDKPLSDYTLPFISLLRGKRLDAVLQQALPMDIEDLWLPFFAVSTNLTHSQAQVHERGALWRAIRASVSLPAILPPHVEDGQLLIDGGVINNLPVDTLRARVAGQVIAVDLAASAHYELVDGRIPSPWDYLKNRLNPQRQHAAAPTALQMIMQITTLASRRERSSNCNGADLYLNPPLSHYGLLAWERLRDIAELGHAHARPRLQQWLDEQPQLSEHHQTLAAWAQAHAQQRRAELLAQQAAAASSRS